MAGQKILSFLVIALFVTFAAAARLLDELDEEDTFPATTTPASASNSGPFPGPLPASGSGSVGAGSGPAVISFGSGTGSIPSSGSGPGATGPGAGTGPVSSSGSGPLPIAGSVPGSLPVGGGPGSLPATGPGPLPAAGSVPLPAGGSSTGPGVGAGPALGGGAGAGPALGGGGIGPDHTLVFFMHDILGGSNPTARAVTGVVANPALSGQLPFAKPNGANLPITNGVPSNNNNNGIVNNNNVPLLVGLGGTTANILQNNGNNGNNNLLNGLPVANGGQLPSGSALQMLMFGTMTVIDDELTEGHELGSGLLGKAQGYYVASAVDGTSQTMAFTAMFENGGYEDSISFFGVHRTAASESHLGVMGGTGKYVNARGFAIVKTFTGSSGTQQQQPHQFTDGLETVLQCTVYLSY
ncbi:unnamed protein product [Eruca vesicaria subsp. sativa]|uniref:Dirigent protein n=1 Tax=Eruca vesicaria subsp. sativa TaxID=29727 RepID=A0ABC8IMA3_ERUVS|nr:unnamed protein product [Eruca vesicaria subsp. sativa]